MDAQFATPSRRVYAAAMRYALLALLLLVLLTGCMTDEADRQFYSGWLNPDAAANARLNSR